MAIRNTVNIAAAVLLVSALALAGCGSDSESASVGGKDVRATVTPAALVDVPQLITASGGVEAATTVMVSTRMMGWVKQVHVQAGDRVKKGDRLVTIDDSDLQAKKAQAEAGIAEARAVLANAETMVGRFERLYAEKSVSKAQLDEVVTGRDRAAAGLKMAEAGLREVKVHLSYLGIDAPADGLVARRMIEPGNMANPGMPMVILEDADRVKIIAHVGEKDVSNLKAGMPLMVDVTSLDGARFETVIDRVVPTANPGSRTYDIEAYLDNADGRLKSGMFARVSVPMGVRKAVLVPADAVVRRGQLTGLWTVDTESRASLRWVRIGRERDGRVEVLSGLAGGEPLVTAPDAPLVEGDKVVTQ